MNYLADTNILSSLAKRQSSQHADVRRALSVLRNRGEEVCLVAQNLIEFWAIATRPTNANGLGLGIPKTFHEIRKFKRYFIFYDEAPGICAIGKILRNAGILPAKIAKAI